MSEEPGFLSRWSRRKQAAREAPAVEAAVEPVPELPPVETLGANSDYAVFLRKGVSALMQQQALQKAWTSDAVIAGFRGMADYDWDFNAVGYGRLRVTDNVGQLLRAVLSQPEAEPVPDAPAALEPIIVRQSLPADPVVAASEPIETGETERPVARRHGSAKPV
jgi:hypothetical protein